MVGNGIGVNSDSCCSARLDHISEFVSGTVSSVELVRSWLIHEPPWIKFTLLRPFVREHRFLWWENFDTHVSSFTEELALFFDVSIWPAEELNDGSLLTVLHVVRLVDRGRLPDHILGLLSDGKFFTVTVSCFDNK